MPPTDPVPTANLIVVEQRGEVHFEAKFRYGGHQVKRRIGRAWLTRDDAGGWRPRRGRVADGYLDVRRWESQRTSQQMNVVIVVSAGVGTEELATRVAS
ncbi:MAG: hypothetical protein ACR2OB_08280 [Solirubrobacteraceae bacterium]